MKAVERKLNKAQLATIWLLIISVLLAAAYVTVTVVIKKLQSDQSGSSGSTTLDLIEGESIYLGQRVAYPAISESQILFVDIEGENGKFGVSRYPDDQGIFLFHYYVDGEEIAIPYTPPIVSAEGEFDYESLYAIETNDGYGRIYYLTYLCSALGASYFSERIPLPSDDTEEGKQAREAMLREYGLTKSEATIVGFEYGERDADTNAIIEDSRQVRVIAIGDKALSGNGYYFMVDDRDYVYYTTSEYFSYALAGFHEFIKGMLVAEGLDGESVYGPYLTTDFKKWTTTVFDSDTDIVFTNDMEGYKQYDNPTVIVNGNYKISVDKGVNFDPETEEFSGYEQTDGTTFAFNLETLKTDAANYARLKRALVGTDGKKVGLYPDNIVVTLLDELYDTNKNITFGEDGKASYRYVISAIESVIIDDEEITEEGTIVDESVELVKVTYRYTVGDVVAQHDCHAVIDLSTLSDADKAAFIGKKVGATDFTIDVEYSTENALKSTEGFVLSSVNSIFMVDDYGTGALVSDVITEDTYVNISYYRTYQVNGKTQQGETETAIIRLSDIQDTDKLAPIKTILLGNGKGSYNKTVYNDDYYYEIMREFVTYEISEIKSVIANEIVVSFEFCNASKRDPFFGDTFFKNTLDNEYKLYGLNSGSCEAVVKLLGGVGTDSSSAVGLSGETVAIGLTIANMEKYGLFAHKIYFEMPRGIYDASEGEESTDDDELSDFDHLSELGFTLYISDPVYDEDGSRIRYIGSDMYDVIAKVPAEDFDFVEYGFVEFWARRHMVMMDIKKLEELRLEFNMQDLTGSYEFEVVYKTAYGGYVDGEYVIQSTEFDGSSTIENEIVNVLASEDAFRTLYKDKFGTEWGTLSALYNDTKGNGKTTYYPGSKTLLGSAYFNSVYETLQLTTYLDVLTEEEQQEAYTKPRIMRLHIKVDGVADYYTYDFYRLDDRRIMVTHYRSDENGNKKESSGEVSDYYITAFAFKKLVNNYIYLLNGEDLDDNLNYT